MSPPGAEPRQGGRDRPVELVVRSVVVELGRRRILDAVDLTALGGEALAVAGHSGAGKTTLLLTMADVLRPTSGSVELGGRPIAEALAGQLRMGFVPQTLGLVATLTAAEHVALPLQACAVSPDEVAARTRTALESVGLAETADRLASHLSGGQRQRLAVARALAARADVLIADEPTAELDAENRANIVSLLLAQRGHGTVVVIATHDQEVVDQCDRVVNLSDGSVETPTMEGPDA